jgi:hypothetical protein
MKKLIISIISVAVVASLLAVAVFAFTSIGSVDADDNATLKRSTYEILSEIAETEDNTFTVSKYNQREIFSDFSPENLDQIFQAFDIVISKNDVLSFEDSYFFRYALAANSGMTHDDYYVENGKMIVSTKINPTNLKYAMLATVYLENFSDYVSISPSDEFIERCNYNVEPILAVSFIDYEKYGFESIDGYREARNAGEIKFDESALFVMRSFDIDIYNYALVKADAKTPNLLEKYNPVPNRIEQEIVQEELAKQKAAN